MEEKTTKSMNLALERPTERLYVLIPTEMERLLNEKAKEMNTKIAHVVRLAIAEFITQVITNKNPTANLGGLTAG